MYDLYTPVFPAAGRVPGARTAEARNSKPCASPGSNPETAHGLGRSPDPTGPELTNAVSPNPVESGSAAATALLLFRQVEATAWSTCLPAGVSWNLCRF
ncbi:hypothetical protein BR93DRAFT_931163 [Coniochaeta sp. PMI_546]|nr:hypothetical protein BR93DRAFT_931163 [Coniochaeta sp. PMI_546]